MPHGFDRYTEPSREWIDANDDYLRTAIGGAIDEADFIIDDHAFIGKCYRCSQYSLQFKYILISFNKRNIGPSAATVDFSLVLDFKCLNNDNQCFEEEDVDDFYSKVNAMLIRNLYSYAEYRLTTDMMNGIDLINDNSIGAIYDPDYKF